MSNDEIFLTKSTVNTKEKIDYEGNQYPLVKLEISQLLIRFILVRRS